MLVGLDVSLNGTGYARSDGAAGVIEPPKVKGKHITGMPRLKFVMDSIWNAIEGADLVVIESTLFSAKGSSFAELTGLGTLLRFTMWEADRLFVDVNNQHLKIFACSTAKAKKPDMLEAAIRKLGWRGSNDDNVVDARWLLEMALMHYERRAPTVRQVEVLDRIDWPVISHSPTSLDVDKQEMAHA
jgi:hypothetical protein